MSESRHNRLTTVETLLREDSGVGRTQLPRLLQFHDDPSTGRVHYPREAEVFSISAFHDVVACTKIQDGGTRVKA